MISKIVSAIVKEAEQIIKSRTKEPLTIDFIDIFPQSEKERNSLIKEAEKIGKQVTKSSTGEVYHLSQPLITKFGLLSLIKIRIVDLARSQRGAPDFKVKDYLAFKKNHLHMAYFNLIVRKQYEMLELNVPNTNVLIYFPSETLSESLGLY